MKQLLSTLVVISLMFSCKKKDSLPPPTTPLVTTAALTNVNLPAGTATAGGSIVSDGGAVVTKSGVVWSNSNAIPTLSDNLIASTATTGAFTSNITGLNFNNTYYVRAFATNSVGTGYGAVVAIGAGSDTSKVRFTYNGQSVAYGIIVSPTTGKKWLDRNLGASQVATAYDDYKAYGDLFQWGRPADGHQLINWTSSTAGAGVNGTTTTLATSDNPGHSNFIVAEYSSANPRQDWRSDNNGNRWATNPQGPCPAGWHIPTMGEWFKETDLSPRDLYGSTVGGTPGGFKDLFSAYSKLKFTAPGYRVAGDPSYGLGTVGTSSERAFYWTSTLGVAASGNRYGTRIRLMADIDESRNIMVDGYSIRCIKD